MTDLDAVELRRLLADLRNAFLPPPQQVLLRQLEQIAERLEQDGAEMVHESSSLPPVIRPSLTLDLPFGPE